MNAALRSTPLLGLAVALAACTIGGSYVGGVSGPADAQVLAYGMAEFVAQELPAASTTLALDPTPASQADNTVTPAFAAALRSQGFAIAGENEAGVRGGHRLRYWVTPLDGGELVRIAIDDRTQGSRFFVRNTAGGLQAGGPFLVRQEGAQSS
jgi:hypothetical protein